MWIVWKLSKGLRLSRMLQSFTLLLMLCVFAFTYFYYTTDERSDYQHYQYLTRNLHNSSVGYLVWNSKCHMLSVNPYDPSIRQFVKKETFEPCSTKPKLTTINRQANGSIHLTVDQDAAKRYVKLSCCWAAISRPTTANEFFLDMDSRISAGPCQDFKDRVVLDKKDVQVLLVTCRDGKAKVIYKNTHSVINPKRARQRLLNKSSSSSMKNKKALSVLMLGLDSVSRLNFHRTMPAACAYFAERGWIELRGYNKMGDNTFPNLMAILTGQNETTSNLRCDAKLPYTLDHCPMIWYNFRDVGYATAYAEDQAGISTFNNVKAGFMKPPTDYYLRPYILASEKLLPTRQRFNCKHCTGPELSVDRIFNAALDFSEAFVGRPSFGFFWSNSISHESMNGPSLYDARFVAKLRAMDDAGVMNDSMVVVLSDHGMRYGDIRDTFVGWYEERLPFFYIWLPEWFRRRNPDAYAALLVNQDRLTSPYDVYETLRDVLQRAGGQAPISTGCPLCSSLFKPTSMERGCRDAGISPHWCTCVGFESYNKSDPIVSEGASQFVEYVNNLTERYKTSLGLRLCSILSLKRIIRVKKLLDYDNLRPTDKVLKLFYLLELTPGGGKFEITMDYRPPGIHIIREEQVSRINLYGHDAICLDKGYKKYCQCRINIAHSILKWF
ncbi:uncharacterized protein LOC131663242 isoform X2 [Phymastichus coffea]|uniref:uncharacterized protein LOC131663242 isoform X2 n=1 Tax=Phymastichus coffea TaxID=108790 RepID=UPI00273CE4EE|nr:uncharacterized protein LOC131663242 isoform X2 [Phymastichus coffea]